MASPRKRSRTASTRVHFATGMQSVPTLRSNLPQNMDQLRAQLQETKQDKLMLEMRIQAEQERRVSAEHEIFDINVSLQRLEAAMFAQEKEINRLKTINRQLLLAKDENLMPDIPIKPQQQTEDGNGPCQKTECKRRRRLLRQIRDKVASYKQLLLNRQQPGTSQHPLDTSFVTEEMQQLLRDNERLTKTVGAYHEYFEFVNNAFHRIFSSQSSSPTP